MVSTTQPLAEPVAANTTMPAPPMFGIADVRQQEVAAQTQRLLGRVIQLLGLLMVGVLAWAWFGRIDVVATAHGKVIPDGRVKLLQPFETSVVKAILVREGQMVKQGDALIELDPTATQADQGRLQTKLWLTRVEIARLQAELEVRTPTYPKDAPRDLIAQQEQLRLARAAAYRAKLADATAQIAQREAALSAGLSTLNKHALTVPIVRERQTSADSLVQQGFISRQGALQTKAESIAADGDLAAQAQVVEQLKHASSDARHQLQALAHSYRAELLAELGAKRELLVTVGADLDKTAQAAILRVLRAPADGVVQSVAVTSVGAVVTAAQPLVAVVPHEAPVLFEAQVSNQDIGFVRAGQSVELRFDAFPYNKYGSVRGELVWVSPDAEESTKAQAQAQPNSTAPDLQSRAGPAYRAHVRIDTSDAHTQVRSHLRVGMSAQALILTDRRRAIEFIWSPVSQSVKDALSTR